MIRVPQKLQKAIEKYPRLRLYAKRARFWAWRRSVRLRTRRNFSFIEPLRMLSVLPSRIDHIGVGWSEEFVGYRKNYEFGRIVGGDWDLNTMPFEDLDIFQAFKARMLHGAPWEQTGYFKAILAQLAAGMTPWEIRNRTDLDARLAELDLLCSTIKDGDYRSQQSSPAHEYSRAAMDEITVRIDRKGHFLFEDGRHRLAIAKLLNLPRIPVMVTWRHADWVRFKAEIIDDARASNSKVYNPITHPDLCDIPSHHDDRRFEMIHAHLPFTGGSLLDLGAHWGYFCHKFEDDGFHCYAVESHARNYYFLNRLKIAEQRRFTTIQASIFEFWEKQEFDVVLALNVFHHFLKSEAEYLKLVEFLKRITTRVMVFQPHLPNDPQMRGAYRNFDNKEFLRFVAENVGLPRCEQIGVDYDGRPLYMLTAQ